MAKAQIEIKATDRTKAAVKSARAGFTRLRKSVLSLKSAFVSMAGAAGIGLAITRILDFTDSIDKASKAARISAESLQRWQFIGNQSGVTMNEMNKSLLNFDKRMSKMLAGQGALNGMLKIADAGFMKILKGAKDNDEALKILTDKLFSLQPKLRGAFIDAAFSSTRLTKIFGGTRAEFDKLVGSVDKLDIIMSQRLITTMAQTKDKLAIVQLQMRKSWALIVEKMLPSIQRLADSFSRNRKEIAKFIQKIIGLITWLGKAVLAVNKFVDDSIEYFKALRGKGGLESSVELLKSYEKQLENINKRSLAAKLVPGVAAWDQFQKKRATEWVDFLKNRVGTLKAKNLFSGLTENFKGALKSTRDFIAGFAKESPEGTGILGGADKSGKGTRRLELLQKRLIDLKTELGMEEDAERASFLKKLEFLNSAYVTKQTTDIERKELETELFKQHEERLTEIGRKEADKRRQVEVLTQQTIITARAGALNAGVGFLRLFAGKSKAAAIAVIAINKGMAIAQAIQATAVASLRALSDLGPIAGAPVAASIQAWGKIQVALIAATGLGQLATLSGSPSGAGGNLNSGVASRGVPDLGKQSEQAQNKTIVLNLGDEKYVPAESVRLLIDDINEALADGATFNITETA